jgi:hypothetical protein
MTDEGLNLHVGNPELLKTIIEDSPVEIYAVYIRMNLHSKAIALALQIALFYIIKQRKNESEPHTENQAAH